jgi:3-carboxy-cis,cis-muconate cycloisomerase
MATDSIFVSKGPAKPFSSRSDRLFGALYGRGEVALHAGDDAWLQAMLDVEAALARACALEGQIPEGAATAIASACDSDAFDIAEIGARAADSATPVVPLVAALRELVGAGHSQYVHHGATSQDILDTAAMLIAKRCLGPLLDDARAGADAAAALAHEHRETPMTGRTLLQQALPTSFGLRAAGWLVGIDEAAARLADVGDTRLAVQMGGAVGSRQPQVAAHVAAELGLAEPTLPWQAIRVRGAELAGALGALAGVLGKIARDVTLLSQNEIGELREGGGPGRGGSTAMAHKHNPVAAISVLACTTRVPGFVATLLSAMVQEHERAAGAWQGEWGTLSELLTLTGSATAWARELLENLEVVPERMLENLARLAADGVSEAAAPLEHLAGAGSLVDRALAAHRR